jgi:hypothetical protein
VLHQIILYFETPVQQDQRGSMQCFEAM